MVPGILYGGLPFRAWQPIRALDNLVFEETLYQSVWSNFDGVARRVPIASGRIEWSAASDWSFIDADSLPGEGVVRALTGAVVGQTLHQSLWRDEAGWERQIPVRAGAIIWSEATAWNGPLGIDTLPGQGQLQGRDDVVLGDILRQDLWRGFEGWSRQVPLHAGEIQWAQATPWQRIASEDDLPGLYNLSALSSARIPIAD